MPVSFGGAAAKPTPAAETPATPPSTPQQMSPAETPAPNKGPSMGFLMQGESAHAALKQEEAKAAAAQAENGKLWRFIIRQKDAGKEYTFTFLDGMLNSAGMLQMVSWYEHTFMLGGRPQHFPCTAAQEPCPMCAGGDVRDLVFGFTGIDHTPYTITKGDKEGQVVPWSRKLYVCKKKTASQLQVMASKLGGLRGARFSITRSGNMSPNVGDTFFPDVRYAEEELVAEFGEDSKPADWAHELTYRTADELVKMGIVEAIKSVEQTGTGFGGAQKTGDFASNF